jgi:Integrase core domain
LDRDSKFDDEVITFLKATGLQPKRTSVQSPWQNGLAERWVGSCRREILDHVIPQNEDHLRRLHGEYVNYHHQDRIHDALEKDTPNRRPVEQKAAASVNSLAGSSKLMPNLFQVSRNFFANTWCAWDNSSAAPFNLNLLFFAC